jgi:hypothetical protein
LTSRTGRGGFTHRFAAPLLALAVLVGGISFSAPSLAQETQETVERPWSLNRLFSNKKAIPVEPSVEIAKPRAKKKKPRIALEPVDPQATVVVKRPDARVVLVVGDFLGSGLAEGLTTAFTQNPNVRVVDRTSGSSGFVRDDFYNWPQKINDLIDTEKPAAIVVMIGANDRQQMQVGDVRETLRSENWTKEYGLRTQALAKAISDRKVPLLWVGVPAFKPSKMLLDMLAFNDVYRAAAASVGAEFVDIWDGFVDENGVYMSNGPDINGQPARLRAADGINLARPGKRKVAFYAEKPLYKLLGETPAGPAPAIASPGAETPLFPFPPMGAVAAAAPAVDLDTVVDPAEPGPIDPARPVSLRSPALDGGTELLGRVAQPRHDARTPGEKLAIEGIAPAALPGRADDFTWPTGAATALAAVSAKSDATAAKGIVPAVLLEPADDIPSPPKASPTAVPAPAPPIPVAEAVPTFLPEPVIHFLRPKAAPSEVVLVAAIPAGLETTKAKSLVSEAVVGGPRNPPALRIAPRGATKLPRTSGPEPLVAPTVLPDRHNFVFVLQAAPSEPVALRATPTPAEAAVIAAKGVVSAALPRDAVDLPLTRLVPRRVTKQPATSGPEAALAPTLLPGASIDPVSPLQIVPDAPAPAPVVSAPAAKEVPSAGLPDGAEAPASPSAAPTALTPVASASTGQPAPAEISQTAPSLAPLAPAMPAASSLEAAAPAQASQPPAPGAPTVLPESANELSPMTAAPAEPTSGPAANGAGSLPASTEGAASPLAVAPLAPAAPTALPFADQSGSAKPSPPANAPVQAGP